MTELKLEDFQENTLSIEDFEGAGPERVKVNDRSASQLSATITSLNGGDVQDYKTLKEDIIYPERRYSFFGKSEDIKRALGGTVSQEAINMVSDTNLEDGLRFQAFNVSQLDSPFIGSEVEALTLVSGMADSDPNESEETSSIRGTIAEFAGKAARQKQELTRLINESEVMKDIEEQSVGGKAVDFVELIAPFAEWIHYERMGNELGLPVSDFALLGNIKKELFDYIDNLPAHEKALATEELISYIKNSDTVILPDGNSLVLLDTLEKAVLDGEYSTAEQWFDNFTSLLDLVGVGGAVRASAKSYKTAKAGANLKKVKEAQRALEKASSPTLKEALDTDGVQVVVSDYVRSSVKPASPSQVVKDANPEEARKMHKIVVEDETGEAAEALYGTNRQEAISNDVLPEVGGPDTPVRNKVVLEPNKHSEPKKLKDIILKTGNTAVSDSELGKVKSKLLSGFENIRGTYFHPESVKIGENLDGTLSVTARYSPVDSGFKSAVRAIENAQYEFRHYGLTEDNFSIYTRQPGSDKWVKTNQKDIEAKKALRDEFSKKKKKIPDDLKDLDYYIGVDYKYRFRPEDLEIDGVLTTGSSLTRFLDSLRPSVWFAKSGQGSIVQNVMDPSSVIHPQIVNPASVAVDRALGIKKQFVEMFERFTDRFNKLPKERRAMMNEYINKANEEGIPLSVTDLLNRGFKEEEISALKEWRRANDAMWWASNLDMIKTLRSLNYKVFTHKDSNTKLFGRPLGKNAASNSRQVYDPVENTFVKPDIDELYENGGEIIKLSEPHNINGQWVDEVMSRNTPQGGYTRALGDEEVVLPYRDGYYPVMYDANWFLEIKITKPDGTEGRKVVASARNLNDAKKLSKDIQEADGVEVNIRKDRRLEQDRVNLFDEGAWSLSTNSGLTSQKIRGERLMDASVNMQTSGRSHLKDPLEAVAEQINSLSQRVAVRDVINTFKERWMQSYGDMLELPKDPNTKQPRFPDSVDQVVGKTETKMGDIADARSNFNYIYSLENGYINGMDELFKGIAHSAAELLAKNGYSKSEEALFGVSKGSPVTKAKTTAFRFFLSANPLRQGIIQRAQIAMLGVVNPKYSLSGEMVQDLIGVRLARAGVPVNKRYRKLLEEVEDSGIFEAVDAHTLIRDDALRLTDLTIMDKVKTYSDKPLQALQKVGFDLAEQDVLLTSWLAHRDLAKRAGKNIKSQRVKDEILGQSRAFTLNMNRSGEMAYSQNTLGLMAQFLSFTHKALLQGLTNKALSRSDRAKLLVYTTAVYGLPATAIGSVVNSLWEGQSPPPNDVRDMMKKGLLDTTLNSVLTHLSGKEQEIDFGDLAPAEAYGTGNMLFSMLDTNIGEAMAESPAGSLLFGNNPRLTEAYKTGVRYFYPPKDYNIEGLDTTYVDVAKSFMNIFSGASNGFKAYYAYKSKKKMSSLGKITDEDITDLEAIAQAAGFRTHTEEGYREFNELKFEGSNWTPKDFDTWYMELKRQLARRGVDARDMKYNQMVLAEAFEVFDDRPKVIKRLKRKIENDAKNKDTVVLEGLVNNMGLMTEKDMWKFINKLPDNVVRDRATQLMISRERMLNGGE